VNLKSACFLLSLCHVGSATALGLGEMEVRSYLGQPLHVTVSIIDATPATEAGCFSLAASESAAVPPPRAKLSLERSGGEALLHVRTAYAINDPIAQFSLISDCESRLRRDYAVLLDPPALAQQTAPLVPNVPVIPAAGAPARPATASPSKRKDVQTPAARPASSPSRWPSPPAQTHQAETAPRLVLSGKRDLAGGGLALRLDTTLPDLNRAPTERLTPDELSDENTSLTRKLAHLQSQLAALQQRNAAIENQRAGKPVAGTLPPLELPPQWPLLLLMLGLLVAAGGLTVLLRRRSQAADSEARQAVPLVQPGPHRLGTPAEFDPMREFPFSPSSETTVVKDDILDQAEVYMAHGHGDLAIHLLHEHLRETPEESPVPWLLLLDLLHREGDTEGYTVASAECRRHFNINLSGHPISQDNGSSNGLEGYPHLLEQLVVAWNSPAIEAFFHDLIYDNRGGTRIGFEPGAYRDILMLRTISREAHPSAA